MSLTKKIGLTLAGLTTAGALILGGMVLNDLIEREECRRIANIPYAQRTLQEEALYDRKMEMTGNKYFIGFGFGLYTLKNHPELKNQTIGEKVNIQNI